MSENTVLPPESQEIDETRSMELRQIATHAGLRGRAQDLGEASAMLWAWSTCPERRDLRWTA